MAKKIDLDDVREIYSKARIRSQAERIGYERKWFRNVLFYMGIQWIQYMPSQRIWVPRSLKPWVPRPVTNKFASHANTIIQVLCAKSPEVSAGPATDNADDIGTADVANRVVEVIFKEADTKSARRATAAWVTLTGNAFLHPNYDNDPQHGTTFFQHYRCRDCGEVFAPDRAGPAIQIPNPLPGGEPAEIAAMPNLRPQAPQELQKSEMSCPKCMSYKVEEAFDEEGEPVGEDLPNGKMAMSVFSPFEIYLDLEARSMAEITEILVRRRYPLEVIQRKFEKYHLEADSSGTSASVSSGLSLLRAIAYADSGTPFGTPYGAGRNMGDNLNITVDCLWKKPCRDFPDGLVAFYANEELLNDKTITDGLPYRKKTDGKPIWPWHHVPFDRVPGRLLGKTPLDDAAPKQEQRNKLESLIELIIRRSANPVWLLAKGTGVTEITGEPGQIIEGNWASDPKLRPQREPGENVPTSVIAWLEKIDRDMEEIVGVFEVMRGSAPPGITAGTALRLLLERAVTRFTPVIETYEEIFSQATENSLIIFQQLATEERINVINGEGGSWEVERFSASDLTGSVNITVEAGSSVPKSAVGQQAMIGDLISLRVVNPQIPEVQYKILEEFGATKLLGAVDSNIKQAQRENWRFMKENRQPKIEPLIDNHIVHMEMHRKLMLTSDFQDLPEQKQAVMKIHLIEHVGMTMGPVPMRDASMGPPMAGEGGDTGGMPLPQGETRPSPESATRATESSPEPPSSAVAENVRPQPGMDERLPPMPGGIM